MNWIAKGLYAAAIMTWETFWALAFGFAISAALQVFVSKDQMSRWFGNAGPKSMILATVFGAASSSCSYAAAAAARSAFKQGAALIPVLAFMFASTNLVIELGGVLWLLMGWRFVLAEAVGAFVLIALMWGLMLLVFPRGLEEEARNHSDSQEDADDHCRHTSGAGHEHGHATGEHQNTKQSRWKDLADAFAMDWQMLWKEIAIGFLIAGFLMALIPMRAWGFVFLSTGPDWLRVVENAAVGPLIAVASFVCSVGNIPLASILWSGGISFGGVVSFIYGDLLIIPLVLIYRKYYGGKTAAYIATIFYLAMVGAGLVVDGLFHVLHLVPQGPRPPALMEQVHFAWNYTTFLDIAAVLMALILWRVHSGKSVEEKGIGGPGAHHHGH